MTENLTIVEFARRFGVSDMTVRRRIKTGKLHAVLHEGRYFIPVEGGQPVKGHGGGQPSAPDAWGRSPAPAVRGRPAAPSEGGFRRPEPRPVEARHIGPGHHQMPMTPMQHVASVAAQAMENGIGAVPPPDFFHEPTYDGGDSALPQSLRRPFNGQETSLVDTRALLAFCEASLKKLNETERRTVEKFKAKLESVEATLATKELEIKTLKQQVEDLQLLVKILEKKKA